MKQQDYLNAGINYEEGVARFVGNADIYEKFLKEFLSDHTFAELEAAIAQKDVHTAFQAAHTLKGLTGNLSLDRLYRQLVSFTDALRGDGDLPLAESLFPSLQKDYRQVVDFLSAQKEG